MKKLMSRKRTFKADDKSENPQVKANSITNAIKMTGKFQKVNVFRKATGTKNKIKTTNKLTKLESTIDKGITPLGNLAFLIRLRSYTIELVVLANVEEKKFQIKRPKNK